MLKKILYLLILLLILGCTKSISFEEAQKEITTQTQIFQKSRVKGEYQKAIDALHSIIELNNQSGGELYESDIYFYLAELYIQTKDYSNALEYYKKSANEYRKEPNRQKEYYVATSWIARILMMKKEYKNSLEYHQQAIKFLKTYQIKDKKLQLSHLYGNIAILYQNIGRYKEALIFNQKSLDTLLKYYPHKLSLISTNYNNISAIKNAIGEYIEAIKYLLKSLEINKQLYGVDNPVLISSYNNLAIHYEEIGEHKKALLYLQKALFIAQKHGIEDEKVANIYEVMADIYRTLRDNSKSLNYHQKSLTLYKKLQKTETLDVAWVYLGLGKYYEEQKEFDRAMSYYQKALDIEKKILKDDNLILAQTYDAIGIIYLATKEYDKAFVSFNRVLDIRKKQLREDNPLLIGTYQNIGVVFFNQKRYKKAYNYFKKSFDSYIKNRDSFFMLLDNQEKISYIKKHKREILLLLESASQLEDSEIATITFDDWLNYKGTLFDRENAINKIYDKADNQLKVKIEMLLSKKRELARLYQQKKENPKIKILQKDISSLELSFEEKISQELNRLSEEQISQYLKDDELYIDYAKVGKRYFLFTLDSKGILTFLRYSMIDSQNISRLVIAFRDAVRKSQETKSISSKLYNILIKKINLDKKSFIISTDGLLRLLPFETLYNVKNRHYLIEEKDIRYTPSGKELIRLYTQNKKEPNNKVVIFDNPDFEANIKTINRGVRNEALFRMKFGELPQTKVEAQAIKSILKNQNIIEYQSKMANEQNLFNLNSPKIVHIATHGFFIHSNLANPMLNSGIALSGANKSIKEGSDGGIITALKLSGINLKGTKIVVLSACQTGLMSSDDTDSISGLSKAFIQAGANGVVVSLWSVSDKGTKEFMELFYQKIADGKDYAVALKEAKVDMIREKKSVFTWGAFILNGKGKN